MGTAVNRAGGGVQDGPTNGDTTDGSFHEADDNDETGSPDEKGSRRSDKASDRLGDRPADRPAERPADRALQVLDRANRVIIEELQRDGRRPYGSIAKNVGLSEAAVRQRVQRLRDSGIIDIVAVTDPLQLGFRRQAMVGVKAEGDLREVADKLAAIPEVEYVVICAGSFDLLVEIVCEDDQHLLDLLNTSIRPVPGVRTTEAFVYLKLAKQSYTWGTR
jgi:Lrp/AsnC family transcriptional regulator, regulator for asnA, asnC and gidA